MAGIDAVAIERALAPHLTDLVAIRRDLHAHPELGFEEHRTAALIVEHLRAVGLEPRTGIAGTGVVADLVGGRPGPTVLLRADMDGLPIDERTDATYGSRVPGRMHACGHDGHVAMLLIAARILAAHRDTIRGAVRLLFQPAEEVPPGGAIGMIEEGALRGVDAALGLHLWNPLPAGSVGVRPGAIMAANDRFDLTLHGQGGHGAMPHDARDPLVGLAHTIVALQTVVSRGVAPLDTAVVTVGEMSSGTAFNVIPDTARLAGSIRTLGTGVRIRVHERMSEVVQGMASAQGLRADLAITEFCPALENDPALAAVGAAVAAGIVGPERIIADFRTTASEDFAFIARAVPSCFLFIGSGRDDGAPVHPHHHPSFDIDERSLGIGVRVLVGAADAVAATLEQARGGG